MSRRLGLLILGAILSTDCHSSPRLMSWQDYRAGRHEWPYVLRLETSRGALLYFGAQHSSDPRDPQFVALEKLWDEFRPDLALNEGGDPPVAQSRDDAIQQYGEAGLVRWLARRSTVPVSSIDLSRERQATMLRASWPSEQVKLFFLMRALLPCERRQGCDRAAEVIRTLPIITSTTGIPSAPNSKEEVEQALAHIAPGERPDTHVQWFDPTEDGHPFNAMARQVEDARDRHMIEVISVALHEGHRVFAVAGGSHVTRQEPVLRLRDKPRAAGHADEN